MSLLFSAKPCRVFVLLGMLKMFDIPMGARHIVIEENETSPHIVGEYVLFRQTRFLVTQLVCDKNSIV